MKQCNFELLRFISTFMIVLLHISAGSVALTMINPDLSFTVSNALDSATRCAVPLFVMLSGAFQLKNYKNAKFSYYYLKTFKSIVVPAIIWSIIYVVYQIGYALFLCKIGYQIYDDFIYTYPLTQFLKGSPYYHLWYLYMAFGLFAVTPILVRIVQKLSKKQIFFFALAMILVAFFITEGVTLIWPLKFIQYLGYYLFGFWINENKESLLKWKAQFLILSIISTITIFYLTEMLVRLGGDFYKPLYFYGFLSPFVILGSLFIFAFFTCLNYKDERILKVSTFSFTIYLSHALILDLLTDLMQYLDIELGVLIRIPVLTIIVFMISLLLSFILDRLSRLFKAVNKKFAK